MGRPPLYFQRENPKTGRSLLVEETAQEFWASLTYPHSDRVEKRSYLGSRRPITLDRICPRQYCPPQPLPMTRPYFSEWGLLADLWEEDLSVFWAKDNAILEIDRYPHLFFFDGATAGFSKAVRQDHSLYGNEWDAELYQDLFGWRRW